MAKLVVNTRELKNEDTFRELKNEVIEILKKQDEREVKKAIEFFSAQENRYTHLEKSITGKWIEKAGYGIGTVRIWKGKKFKKIAPNKWVRIYEKEGRGTNIAIGKLIAKVQKIDNVEDLMDFVMANKQRFVDDNGIDLPVLDKLRAAVDKKNNGGIGSKGTSKPAENKYKGLSESELKKEVISEYDKLSKIPDKKQQDIYETIEEIKNRNGKLYEAINEKFGEKTDKVFIEAAVERLTRKEKKNKKPAEKYDAKAYEEEKDNVLRHTNKDFDSVDAAIFDLNRHKNWIDRKSSDETEHEKNVREARLKAVDDIIEGLKRGDNKLLDKFVKNKPAEKKKESDADRLKRRAEDNYGDWSKKDLESELKNLKEKAKEGFNVSDDREQIKYILENKDFDEDTKDYWIQDSKGNRITSSEAKARIKDQLNQIDSFNELIAERSKADSVKMEVAKRSLEEDNKHLMDRLNPDDRKEMESEFEKHQNRSSAMKGNKNAYKGGSKEELQNELMSLSKQKSEILDEIKKTNGDLAKINQDKYNDEARGNPTEDYDKQIEELKKKMDNLQDEHADIEKRGNDIVKELDKLEKEENKVIENNPKSIEGMEFVNKNKMHALANFLANHDNVNMATAVIRLQAAYEKLGEEKFLSYFPKDVVERYRKEAGKEETKKESFTPISKDKMKSMSDDELKDYEAKLEKDLLATSRTAPDYVEKYNHWREVHGENNDRFHQAIEDEARAEKQAEADAKSAKEKEINEKYNGYFENRKGLDKARDLKTLEKKYNFDGKVMSYQEMADHYINNLGGRASSHEYLTASGNKKMTYGIYDKDGRGYEVPKIVYDYAMHISNNNINKSITDLILMADYAHEEFEDEEEQEEEDSFNDFSAENPDLFNSTSYKVREAMCRCGVL